MEPLERNESDRVAGAAQETHDPEKDQTMNFLGRVEPFKHLEQDALEKLASRIHLVSLAEGHILRENEPADGLYIIKSGIVEVTKPTETGEAEVQLAMLHQGDFFGEIGLIDGLPRSANVAALEPTECYFLPRPVFLTILEENPEIALAMLPALANMVRIADQKAESILALLLKGK